MISKLTWLVCLASAGVTRVFLMTSEPQFADIEFALLVDSSRLVNATIFDHVIKNMTVRVVETMFGYTSTFVVIQYGCFGNDNGHSCYMHHRTDSHGQAVIVENIHKCMWHGGGEANMVPALQMVAKNFEHGDRNHQVVLLLGSGEVHDYAQALRARKQLDVAYFCAYVFNASVSDSAAYKALVKPKSCVFKESEFEIMLRHVAEKLHQHKRLDRIPGWAVVLIGIVMILSLVACGCVLESAHRWQHKADLKREKARLLSRQTASNDIDR